MRFNIKKHCLWALFFLTLIVLVNAGAKAQPPTLYGRVLVETPSGTAPLSGAAVELLDVQSNRILWGAYTDSYGGYAFYGIPRGCYNIGVRFGGRVIFKGNRPVCVEDPNDSWMLPDIIITQR